LANTASKLSFEPEPQDDMDFEVEQVQEKRVQQAKYGFGEGNFKVVDDRIPLPPKKVVEKVVGGRQIQIPQGVEYR